MPSTFQKSCETEDGKYVGPMRHSKISQSQPEEVVAIPEVALFQISVFQHCYLFLPGNIYAKWTLLTSVLFPSVSGTDFEN